MHILIFDFNNT